MILVSAQFVELLCILNFNLKVIAFTFSILVIGAKSHYHIIALYKLITYLSIRPYYK